MSAQAIAISLLRVSTTGVRTRLDATAELNVAQTDADLPARNVCLAVESPARRRWRADTQLVEQLICAFFANRWDEAAALCSRGAAQPPLPPDEHLAPNGDRFRDTRGSVAMVHALLTTARGIMEVERDSLSRALPSLFAAEQLLSETEPWVAQQLMRGLCEASIGGLLLMQRRYAKGAWHMLKAYSALRHLSIASLLEYDGMEGPVVRSLALYFLGGKAIVLGLLPPTVTRFFPGFTSRGDRQQGLSMLRQCADEDGVFAPFARDALLAYHVALKEVFLLPWTSADWAEVDQLTAAADDAFGRTSMPFATKIAAVHGWRHQPAVALGRITEITLDPGLATMPFLQAMLRMEQANYHLATLEWRQAARQIQAGFKLFEARGKRSGVPAMCALAARIFTAVGDDDGARECISIAMALRTGGADDDSGAHVGDSRGSRGSSGSMNDDGWPNGRDGRDDGWSDGGSGGWCHSGDDSKSGEGAKYGAEVEGDVDDLDEAPRATGQVRPSTPTGRGAEGLDGAPRRKNWKGPDMLAFRYFDWSATLGEQERRQDALHRVIIHMWSSNALCYIQPVDARKLVERLSRLPSSLSPFYVCHAACSRAMVCVQQAASNPSAREALCEETLAHCAVGLELSSAARACPEHKYLSLGRLLHYYAAVAEARRHRLLAARAAVKRAESVPKASTPWPITRAVDGLLLPLLNQQLRTCIDAECAHLVLAAGATQAAEVDGAVGSVVEWEWVADRGSAVTCVASVADATDDSITFTDGSGSECALANVPIYGRHTIGSNGKVRLQWTNHETSGWILGGTARVQYWARVLTPESST